jgi:hypothetical protein
MAAGAASTGRLLLRGIPLEVLEGIAPETGWCDVSWKGARAYYCSPEYAQAKAKRRGGVADAVCWCSRACEPERGAWRSTTRALRIRRRAELQFHRRGQLLAGQNFSCSWECGGEPFGSISVCVEADALVLMFRVQCWGTSGNLLNSTFHYRDRL